MVKNYGLSRVVVVSLIITILVAIASFYMGFLYAGSGWGTAAIQQRTITLPAFETVTVMQTIVKTATYTQLTQTTPSREALMAPLVEAAKREGKVVIYSSLDRPSADPLLKRFKELYPFIDVEYLEMGTATIFSRFRSEASSGAPTADIIWSPAADLQLILINEGYAQPYRLTIYDQLPPDTKFKDLAYVTSWTLVAPIYNKDKIPESLRPKSYRDILNLMESRKDLFPKGSVCVFDPVRSGVALTFMYYQRKYMEPLFTSILSKAAEIGAQLHSASGPQIEKVKTGECIISTGLIANYAFRDAQTDPRLGVFIPEDYAILVPRIIFITKQAQHPNSAKLFLEFIFSDEGQKLLAQSSEVTIYDNPYIRELSLPYITKYSKNIIMIRLGDDTLQNLINETERNSFLEYFRSVMGIK